MTLVRGAARGATGPPAGALLTAGARPFELRTAPSTAAGDATTISVCNRGTAGPPPEHLPAPAGAALGGAVAGRSWRAVRPPAEALRAAASAVDRGARGRASSRLRLHRPARALPARRALRRRAPTGHAPRELGSAPPYRLARRRGRAVALEQRRRASGSESRGQTKRGRARPVDGRLPARLPCARSSQGSEAVAAGASGVRTRRA